MCLCVDFESSFITISVLFQLYVFVFLLSRRYDEFCQHMLDKKVWVVTLGRCNLFQFVCCSVPVFLIQIVKMRAVVQLKLLACTIDIGYFLSSQSVDSYKLYLCVCVCVCLSVPLLQLISRLLWVGFWSNLVKMLELCPIDCIKISLRYAAWVIFF